MSTREVRFDLTLFNTDGNTTLWGSASEYVVSEASFSTPGDYSAPRQYLRVPENFLASQTDFLKGTSDIGGVSVDIVDVRQTSTDQTSGIVTSKIDEIVGSEAILRRWFDSLGIWRTVFRGRVASYSVNEDELVVYRLNLEDPRAYEEEGRLFETNETYCLYPTPGPVNNYALFPSGEDYLLPAAGIATVDVGNVTITADTGYLAPGQGGRQVGDTYQCYFRLTRANDLDNDPNYDNPPYEQFQARLETLKQQADTDPIRASDGDNVIRGIVIRWRESSGDDWTYIRDLPANGQIGNAVVRITREEALIYAASKTDAEIPQLGTTVEFQVLAGTTTDTTPYFWDNGTLGDLLFEISRGDLTDDTPKETYDATALTAFRDASVSGRFIETAPRDRRKWVQKNIYQASLRAPCMTQDYSIRPVGWEAPDDLSSSPVLQQESILPVGDYRAEFSSAYNTIIANLIVENVRTQEYIERVKEGRLLSFGSDTATINLKLTPWERFDGVAKPFEEEDTDAVAKVGRKTVDFSPVTLRAIGEARLGEGGRRIVGGDTQDPTAGLIASRYIEAARDRYIPNGAPRYRVPCVMSDAVVRDVEVGDFLRVEAPWLPDRSTLKRNHVRYMQVYGLEDNTPEVRTLFLEDIGILAPSDDNTSDPDNPTEDCIDQGSTEYSFRSIGINGEKIIGFTETGTYQFVNNCSEAITADVLLIAGGGGGGGGETAGTTAACGGGGGAGGVYGAYGVDDIIDQDQDPVTITINAGEIIPVTVGIGGGGGTSGGDGSDGGDTIIWVDGSGNALDPLSDTPIYRAVGGGGGGSATINSEGRDGGSGGGGGNTTNIVNSFTNGGSNFEDQGRPGAAGLASGDGVALRTTIAGSGGAFGGPGTGADNTGEGQQQGGDGVTLTNWGITTGWGGGGGYARIGGVGDDDIREGSELNGSGGVWGAAGGGGAATDGQAGRKGIAVLRYKGSTPSLTAPDATAETPSGNENVVCVTVAEADWPAIEPPDYRVRVDYALSPSEPAADSGLWITAGYLDDPGTVCTPPLPTGATVHTRVVALSSAAPPSTPVSTTPITTPETPDLLSFSLSRDGEAVTAAFTPNDYAGGIRFAGYVGTEDDTYDDTNNANLADVDADDGTWPATLSIAEGEQLFLSAESYSGISILDPDEALVVADDFNRANSSTVGNGWDEEVSGTASISSNRAEIDASTAAGVRLSRADVGTTEVFVQATVRAESIAALPYLDVYDPATDDGYTAKVQGVGVNPQGIYRLDAGAQTQLDSTGDDITAATDTTVQFYVANSLQEMFFEEGVATATASATDTTHVGPFEVALRGASNSGTVFSQFDDVVVCSGKFITVTDLPTGYDVQVLDGSNNVIASATESGGTASVDCSRFGGATENVPVAGFAQLRVRTAADATAYTLTGAGIYPGMSVAWNSADNELGGVTGTQGNTQVRSIAFATQRTEESGTALATLNRLTFDDDLNLVLDNDNNPTLTD